MSLEQTFEILAQNRELIEIHANLKEIQKTNKNENLETAVAIIGKAIELLSEV